MTNFFKSKIVDILVQARFLLTAGHFIASITLFYSVPSNIIGTISPATASGSNYSLSKFDSAHIA